MARTMFKYTVPEEEFHEKFLIPLASCFYLKIVLNLI